MSDQELIDQTTNEGTIISYEAFIILKNEFKKRNLDKEIIENIELKRVDAGKDKILNNIQKEEEAINEQLWDFIIDQKYNDQTDEEIIQGLVEKGVSIEDSNNAVKNLNTLVENASKKAGNKVVTGFIAICAAAIIAYLIYLYSDSLLWLFFPIIFIARMVGPLYRYFERNEKYNVILKNLRQK